ncbi:sporulation protein [Neobacillus mesonae]|uniref:sporulation protein n=1 Tax=Neobacillus mesonae TaxID=1193713 RepID=UPI00203E4888|nr:sporulation protein [Neobacillus mesonae]MCM3569969.1 sporulation protein [Neobacillus mesonae]
MFTIRPLLLFSIIFVLASCSQNQEVKDSQLALMKTTNPGPVVTDHDGQSLGKSIKEDVETFPQLYDIAIVKGEKDILVVYKVKHLQRFRMKKIEKEVTKKLEKKYPDEKFTVSSDYKIFLEAVRLEEKIKSEKFTKKQAEKRLKEIIKMTEDLK